MTPQIDLAVIGAGPAGLAAAVTARELGLTVTLFDEQPQPGGQIYRSIESAAGSPQAHQILGVDYAAGTALARAFRSCAAQYRAQTSVWRVDADRRVYYSAAGAAASVGARQVLIACGAMERPMPFAGWTLPGVMSCGAAQIMLKAAACVPDGRVYLAGGGPLLLLLAAQLLRAGVRPAAIIETMPRTNFWSAMAHLPRFLAAPGYLGKGIALLREIRRAGVPILRGASELRACGKQRLESIEFRFGGSVRSEQADLLLVHQGVVPNANLTLSTRCRHEWVDAQRCFRPVVDEWGATSIDGIRVAGDNAGIIGAQAAEISGRIAALGCAFELGHIGASDRDWRMRDAAESLDRHLRARPFLDALYRPAPALLAPRDDATLVCRCEEVSAGEIRRIVANGCPGPNQMKAFARAGMGPCQGRLCGLTVTEIIAEARAVSPQEVGYYRIRSPVKPLTMGELASFEEN